MQSIEEQLISEIKLYINVGDLTGLKALCDEYINQTEFERDVAWDFVFQKVYLHAALKGREEICGWLDDLFKQMNPVSQIALRQMFPYARQLLRRKVKS